MKYLIILLFIVGCSSSTNSKTNERVSLTITEKKSEMECTEKTINAECFCPENKDGTANVISAVGGLLSSVVGAIF